MDAIGKFFLVLITLILGVILIGLAVTICIGIGVLVSNVLDNFVSVELSMKIGGLVTLLLLFGTIITMAVLSENE